jgi:hypothetical protein
MWDVRSTSVRLKGENGILLTQKLFLEFGDEQSPYTLKAQDVEKDGVTYVSLYKVYMESADEYDAAMRLLGSMKHWRKLCGLKWFQEGWEEHGFDGLNLMREDMMNRDRSLAKTELLKAANAGNVSAMKILYDQTAPKKPARQQKTQNNSGVEQDLLSAFSVIRGSKG